MSNFTGVTFAQQKVLPSDDAIIRRSILSDGILYGCEISYSGSTLTMGAGQLLICGRQIRHPSAQNWAVADATSGFARLVLTVDLTRTASKDVFEQVVDLIEYATAQDGFPDLNQSNVNTTGSVYQIVACVVSLGTGGITGVVDQLKPCEVVGGGGGLNFKLVGGLTQPTDPAENIIWVETNFEITGYSFSVSQPTEPTEGMVWITVGASSPVAFNALKKNNITVYPLSAKQYVDGAWVDKPAKSYQGGEWVSWINEIYLYDNGTFSDSVGELVQTGMKEGTASGYSGGVCTITKNANSVKISSNGGKGAIAYFPKKIDLTSYENLYFKGSTSVKRSSNNGRLVIGVWKEFGSTCDDNKGAALEGEMADGLHTLPISALEGEYYVGVFVSGFTDYVYATMKELYLK